MTMSRLLVLASLLAFLVSPRPASAFGDKVQYDLKLPTGFQRQVTGTPGKGVEATRFAGKQRRDGTRPVLVVTTVRLPPDQKKRNDEALREMLVEKHVSELRGTYKVSDYVREAVRLGPGALPAVKLGWENDFGDPPKVMKVVMMIAVVDRLAVIMRAEDLGDLRSDGVFDMEQAMSTFTLTRR
jgi:hypothetical protein